jgi:hypothetical protein
MISSLRRQNITIKLTRSFKGIVLNQNVNISEVNKGCASFRVIGKKIYSGLEEFVHLQSDFFPKAMVARIKSLDINKGTIILSQFAYTETDWKERKEERVRPKSPIYLDLHWKTKVINACLMDFSATGIGISAQTILESGMNIWNGLNIKLNFQFSPNDTFTLMKGKIVYSHVINRTLVKLGILLFPNAEETLSLKRLFTNRKLETMNELDQNFKEFYKRPGVESMYF